MTPEEFRTAGHALVDWVADHRSRLGDLPVAATTAPGEVAAGLAAHAPDRPEPLDGLLADLERVVVPGLTQIQSPRYFGWFPSNASLASVLGDLASGGLGALGISWASAPALTEMEEVVTEWLREATGLAPGWRGAIHDTASTACLVALLAARERAGGHSAARGGLQELDRPLVVYASREAHSSVDKAVVLAGFGAGNLRHVPVDPLTLAMDAEALAAAMASDAAAGRVPAAVVATVGTTATTAVDPVPAVVRVAARHGAWVHVDAAMAGSALLLPERRGDLGDGLDGADSLCWNPHKWLGTILDCSLLYVRDPDALVRFLATDPSYLQSAVDGRVTQYRDWGVPLGRRFRALKLWFHLRLDGLDAIRDRLRRDLAHAAWLAEEVRRAPDWRLVAPCRLQTVVIRHEPPGLTGEALDAHTRAWATAVNESGRAFLTPARVAGRWSVRISLGSEATERHHVEDLWRLVRDSARREGVPRSP
ncbi:MAG: pyridoxal phosphate-dependent decarboxylase family protein [Kineosporiaceae bacterium]